MIKEFEDICSLPLSRASPFPFVKCLMMKLSFPIRWNDTISLPISLARSADQTLHQYHQGRLQHFLLLFPRDQQLCQFFILVIAFHHHLKHLYIWEGPNNRGQQFRSSGFQEKLFIQKAAHSVVFQATFPWPRCQKRGLPESSLTHLVHQPHLGCLFLNCFCNF